MNPRAFAQMQLKIRLLRAQRDRALSYDVEWGPDPEDRPLYRLAMMEDRALRGESPGTRIVRLLYESTLRSIVKSNEMMRTALYVRHDGGNRINVPLTFKEE